MRTATLATIGLGVGCLICSGCCGRDWTWLTAPHRSGETLTQNCDDHKEYVNRVADHDARAINDDLDLIFMTDRPSRLNRWHDK